MICGLKKRQLQAKVNTIKKDSAGKNSKLQ